MGIKLLKKIGKIYDRIIGITTILAGVLLIFLMLSVGWEVALRYFFGRPTSWVVEIAGYILLYIPFLVAAWVLKREGHVKMDLVVNRLSPRTQALTNMITSVLGAIFCLVVAWYGAGTTWDMFQRGIHRSTVLMAPVAPLIAIIPIGFFLLFIQFLRRTYKYLGGWRASRVREQRR